MQKRVFWVARNAMALECIPQGASLCFLPWKMFRGLGRVTLHYSKELSVAVLMAVGFCYLILLASAFIELLVNCLERHKPCFKLRDTNIQMKE